MSMCEVADRQTSQGVKQVGVAGDELIEDVGSPHWSKCCFLTHIQVSQETGKVVCYFCLLKNPGGVADLGDPTHRGRHRGSFRTLHGDVNAA